MTTNGQTLLVIEDNRGDFLLLCEMVNEQGPHNTTMVHVESMQEAEAHLALKRADIILLDLGLHDAQGLEAVRRANAAAPRTPLVVLTGTDDQTLASQSLKRGAQDFLIKGQIDSRSLLRALRYAVDRKVMEEELFTQTERAQVTLNCIADAVAVTDSAGNISYLNHVAEALTGWSLNEAAGRPGGDILRIRDTANRAVALEPFDARPGASQPAAMDNYTLVRRDGLAIAIEDSIAPIHDRQGAATGAVIVFRDVRAARATALELSHLARHDFLTGLPNRVLLNDRINHAIAAAPRHQKKVGVLFLDLDGFKHINDSLGHPIGDKLLQSVARRLVGCVRGADTVSRQGGDEFVVLLAEMERPEDAAILATRILQSVAEAHSIETHDLHVTASIGVSVYPDDGRDAETLVKHADTAMYQAKESGRQGYRFFTPAMNVRAVERQFIESGLRRAIERHEFSLNYQPKIDLRTGEIDGAEALVRWLHPSRGFVPPGEFILVAEACGLIQTIGNWVLWEACRQAQSWIAAGLELPRIAVNISSMEFRAENFLEGVFRVLDETGLAPERLELELTESVLMRDAASTDAILKALRDIGVKLAVDDFGTGYSSLSYLRKFAIDTLKIDQSFIRQIDVERADTSIITAVLDMARSLKLRVVAEGVETSEELDFLQQHDCDVAQGYYFSPAVPPAEFATLLKSGIISTIAAREHARRPARGEVLVPLKAARV